MGLYTRVSLPSHVPSAFGSHSHMALLNITCSKRSICVYIPLDAYVEDGRAGTVPTHDRDGPPEQVHMDEGLAQYDQMLCTSSDSERAQHRSSSQSAHGSQRSDCQLCA